MEWMFVSLTTICQISPLEVASSMKIVCYPSQGGKVFQPQFHQVSRYEATTVGREMWITYNAVCITIHKGLENVETFSSRPRPRSRLFLQDQDQDQDHFSWPRGASRPRPRSRDYIAGIKSYEKKPEKGNTVRPSTIRWNAYNWNGKHVLWHVALLHKSVY